jgi:hypothetical protein
MMNMRFGNLLPLSLAAAFGRAASTTAMALAIISKVGVSNTFEQRAVPLANSCTKSGLARLLVLQPWTQRG